MIFICVASDLNFKVIFLHCYFIHCVNCFKIIKHFCTVELVAQHFKFTVYFYKGIDICANPKQITCSTFILYSHISRQDAWTSDAGT